MSEVIDYWGEITGFKPEEKEEIIELALNFQEADVDHRNNDTITFDVNGGWRGGGCSCKELVESHFKEYCENHPNIHIRVWAKYVEQAPCELIELEAKEETTARIV